MNRFDRVVQILDEAIGGPDVGIAAHSTFWRGLTRDEFVAKKVRNRELVSLGDGAASNLVRALKGEAPFGSDLDNAPDGAVMPRMPFGFDPVPDDGIAFIAAWIDDGCPDEGAPPEATLAWGPSSAPLATRYDDIWFVTTEVGWAINSNGQILKTTDGARTWQEQFHVTADGDDVWLRCIGFASENRGWVGTTAGQDRLYETSDGGTTWTPVANLPADAPAAVCGLWVVNESVVYASGTNYPFPQFRDRPPRVLKTVDGGRTWTASDMSPHAALLVDTYFTTPERGWVVGGKVHPVTEGANQCKARPDRENIKPVVLFTEDGGQTWVNQLAGMEDEFPLGEWGWKISFVDDEVGFVSLENFCNGAILKTTDGGRTWRRLPINDAQGNANLEGIGFADRDHGWVGGWGSKDMKKGCSSQTDDGGETWTDADWGTAAKGEFLNRFRFFGHPVSVGYASGDTVYKYSAEPVVSAATKAPAPSLFDETRPTPTARPAKVHVTVPAGATRLSVDAFDRFGDHVRRLVREANPDVGQRVVQWDITNDDGEHLEPGYYIVRATVDDLSDSSLVQVAD